jgi:hypothetical protein
MGTSGEPMPLIFLVRLFLLSLIFYLTAFSLVPRRNILSADERPVLGYDVMILLARDLLRFFTSHDGLITTIQMPLAKLESARIYVGVSLFLLDLRLFIETEGNHICQAGSYTRTLLYFYSKGNEAGLSFTA